MVILSILVDNLDGLIFIVEVKNQPVKFYRASTCEKD